MNIQRLAVGLENKESEEGHLRLERQCEPKAEMTLLRIKRGNQAFCSAFPRWSGI